jgi:hypothetical protein
METSGTSQWRKVNDNGNRELCLNNGFVLLLVGAVETKITQ